MIKKILFASYISNIRDMYFGEYLVKFLINQKYSIKVISNKKYITEFHNIYDDTISKKSNQYDLVLLHNKQAFKLINKMAITPPIFYLFNSDEIFKEQIEMNKYSELFLCGKPKILIDNSFYNLLNIYFDETFDDEQMKQEENIIIAESSMITINKLMPWLNTLVSSNIYIISIKNHINSKYFNSNVHIVNNKNKIDRLFRNAKLIIADDQFAIKGIMLKKPVLLLGSYGYGGLITNDNIDLLYKYGFTGRPGGNFDEHLPFELINYDFQEAYHLSDNELEAAKMKLKNYLNIEYSTFIKKIDFYIEINLNKIQKYTLVINPMFSVIQVNATKTFYLINNITCQFLYELTEEESIYLDFFKNPHLIKDFKHDIYRINIEIIKEFISSKILIYDTGI